MKRYDVAPHGSTEDMVPAANGDWVLFEDAVDRIKAELMAFARDFALAERAACAAICEREAEHNGMAAGWHLAALIRERSNVGIEPRRAQQEDID